MEDTEKRTKTSQRLQNGNIALNGIKQKHHNEDRTETSQFKYQNGNITVEDKNGNITTEDKNGNITMEDKNGNITMEDKTETSQWKIKRKHHNGRYGTETWH